MPDNNNAMTVTNSEALAFEPRTMDEARALAVEFAKSDLIPKHLRGKPADVLVTIAYGREIGISPIAAMQDINVINGKPGVSADLAVALCIKRPAICEYFVLVEASAKVATYETKRKGDPRATQLSFTIEEAQRAGLMSNPTWQKYPATMLRHRAAMHLARERYPDLVKNLRSHDELEEMQTTQTVAPVIGGIPFGGRGAMAGGQGLAGEVIDVQAEVVAERPITSDPPRNDTPPPGEPLTPSELETALELAKTEKEVTSLAPDVKYHAGDNKSHRLRVAYVAAYRRVTSGTTGSAA